MAQIIIFRINKTQKKEIKQTNKIYYLQQQKNR